jgi:protocatechuate 3,4-dioxygenase beta subunit
MPSEDPVLDMSLRELRAVLFEEIERLPEQYRAPLVLCGLEEKPLEEAARLLGSTRGSVKGRLQRGRDLLRVRLRRRGLELPAALSATALALHSAPGPVSAALADTTLRAAFQVAAGQGVAAGAVSADVAALIEGASKTMFIAKIKIFTAVWLAGSLAATAVGVLRHQVSAADKPPTQRNEVKDAKSQGDRPLVGEQPDLDAQAKVKLRGCVLDPAGKPLAGAKIYLTKSSFAGQAHSQQVASGPDGRFRLTVPKSVIETSVLGGSQGKWSTQTQIMAVADGYGCDWVKVGSTDEEITLHLVEDMLINGRILGPDGRPIAGAKIRGTGLIAFKGENLGDYLMAARKGQGFPSHKTWVGPLPAQFPVLTTAADGRFRMTGAGRERVIQFRVEGPGIASSYLGDVMTRATETILVPGKPAVYGATFDYVAQASRPICGVVHDKETKKPLADVTVEHYHGQGPKAVTDREGRYELLDLAKAPEYSLQVKPANGLYFRRQLRVHDTPGLGPLMADIELARGCTVRGRVMDKERGQPIPRARIEYHPLAGNTYANQLAGVAKPCVEAITGPDGSYALTVLPGPGVIGVTGPRSQTYMPALVTPKELKDFFKVPVIEDQSEDYLTLSAGANSFTGISQDSYHALILLEPGEKEDELVKDVALERPRERRGRVLDPNGQPLSGVTAIGLTPYSLYLQGIETLKEAEFTVRGINPRANRPLVFYHREKKLGFYMKELRGESTEPLTVKLQPCGSASGRVVDADGIPIASLAIHVMGNALHISGEEGGGWQTITTDAQGRFRAEGLVPGQEYVVWEYGKNASLPRIYAPVVVEPGQHKEMGDIKMVDRD